MPPVKLTEDLVGVGKRLAADDNLHSALIVSEAAIKMFNIATLLSTAIDILDEELMPQIGSLAIQDFAGRHGGLFAALCYRRTGMRFSNAHISHPKFPSLFITSKVRCRAYAMASSKSGSNPSLRTSLMRASNSIRKTDSRNVMLLPLLFEQTGH